MQVGLVVMDENPADALKIVRAAERAGVHSLWTIDYYNRSSLARAAAFAAVSETAIVGTSVTPLFARSPLALAAAAADIQALAGGRTRSDLPSQPDRTPGWCEHRPQPGTSLRCGSRCGRASA